jgi:hypothetical protein
MTVPQVLIKAFMIIRDDGLYIEQYHGNGATHIEPGNHFPPRLWFHKAKAKGWLTVYCRGAWTVSHQRGYSLDGADDDPVHIIKPVEGRTVDRFTIKEVLVHDL